MISLIVQWPWRALLLLLQALAPWLAPLDAVPASSNMSAALRLALALAVLVAAGVAAHRAWRVNRLCGGMLTLTLLGALLGSAGTFGAWGPLARAAWAVSPLLWMALALCAARFALGASKASGSRLALAAVLGAALSAAGVAAARGRLTSPEKLNEAALARDPGNERAALAAASALQARGEHKAASAVLLRCAQASADSCTCASRSVEVALDHGEHENALALLETSGPRCGWPPHQIGMRAEALAGLGRLEDASREAASALRADARQPHALFATSRVAWLAGDGTRSLEYAARAVEAGHGLGGRLQYGMLLMQSGALEEARQQFEAAVRSHPHDATASYDLALASHRLGRYRDAREGYLTTLRLNPSAADARYNLALLTHAAGAADEARHHLEKFAAMAPSDPRVPQLRQMLSGGAR
jgi:tetratricopeptide (TPR) repeat protein